MYAIESDSRFHWLTNKNDFTEGQLDLRAGALEQEINHNLSSGQILKEEGRNMKVVLSVLFMVGLAWAGEPAKHFEAHDAISAEQSLGWLKNGNIRFVKGRFRSDGRRQSDVKRLVSGQKPHAIILSCSDSRVPPEHVFDQSLGEIFVIRVAGEALDASVIASVEYAVEHLGVKNVVVMGHTHCGAVKAAIAARPGVSSGSPSLDSLVSDIKPRLPASVGNTDVANEAFENAKGISRDLLKRSKILSEKVNSSDVKVSPALYHLESGKVEWVN